MRTQQWESCSVFALARTLVALYLYQNQFTDISEHHRISRALILGRFRLEDLKSQQLNSIRGKVAVRRHGPSRVNPPVNVLQKVINAERQAPERYVDELDDFVTTWLDDFRYPPGDGLRVKRGGTDGIGTIFKNPSLGCRVLLRLICPWKTGPASNTLSIVATNGLH